MPPLPVREDLDVLRDLLPRLLARLISPMMHQLIFDRPETPHRGIVIAIASPTHRRGQTEQPRLE